MKKKLNEAGVANELRGASLFFPPPSDEGEEPAAKPRQRAASRKKRAAAASAVVDRSTEQPADEPALPEALPSPATTTLAEPEADQLVESIRKAVKQLGKEATFCRFTPEEKQQLGDIIYTYKRNGIRTSENEVIRIAVNWLVENHRIEGSNSMLAQVLDKLNT
ncbi:MAG TPA: hypothetical protein PKE45_00225 [Caldilineaceae bacterium]|nr:hypothetical protein [Caldilineaceae bacterium]